MSRRTLPSLLAMGLLALLAAPAPALCGDCNTDGVVNILDVLRALHNHLGTWPLTGLGFTNCDVAPAGAGDGQVTVLDALLIAQHAVGLVPTLTCPTMAAGCPPATPDAVLLDTVVSYDPGVIISAGADPAFSVNGVNGGGCCTGSLDVTSLGSAASGWGGQLTLRLAGKVIRNGPGPDLVVYENPFYIMGGLEGSGFFETGIIQVSMDGLSWVTFPVVFDDRFPPTDRRRYARGFCGVEPVYLRTGLGDIPGDPAGGGDAFDLDDAGLCEVRYVRIRDTGQIYPDLNYPPGDCDIDGVAALYTAPDP